MREPIKDRGRLEHMLTAIANVEEFTQGITLDDFVKSKSPEKVWDTVQEDLPVLKEQIAALLNE